MPEAPVPQGGADEAPAQGGGVAEKIVSLDRDLAQLAQVVTQNEQIPDELKAPLQASVEAFRAFAQGLTEFAGGGGGQAPQQGVVSPEQGASGAQPVSMGRPR
jgi:hypothetical protein